MRKIFVTGIGTDIGKTIVSAILVEKIKADYWKPVQSGELDNTDTDKVRGLVSNMVTVFHPEAYRLTKSLSPHYSSELDGIFIDPRILTLPDSKNDIQSKNRRFQSPGLIFYCYLLIPLNELANK